MEIKKYFKLFNDREKIKKSILCGINISLILLSLNLLSVNLYIYKASFMRILTVYLLLGFFIINLPFKNLYRKFKKKTRNRHTFYDAGITLFLIVFSFVILLFSGNQMLWLTSIPIMTSGLFIGLKKLKYKRRELKLLTFASFIYALFYILTQNIPTLWQVIQKFSLSLSEIIGGTVGKSLLLGPSTSGLWITIIFVMFSLSIFVFLDRNKKKVFLNILGIFICWIFYLVILSLISFSSKSEVINLHLFLFILLLVPTFLYLSKSKIRENATEIFSIRRIDIRKLTKNGAVWSLIFLLISMVILTSFLPETQIQGDKEEKKTVLLYGENMLGGWTVPEYGRYGKEGVGMFGLLPYYINQSNYNVRIVVENRSIFMEQNFPTNKSFPQSSNLTNLTESKDTNLSVNNTIIRYINFTDYTTVVESKNVTSDLLKEIDVFVVINLNESFSEREHNTIWNFVENGGSLLVLGDHTDIGGMQQPLNNLLEPVDIRYRFDAALPIDKNFKWIPCYHLLNNPVSYKIDSLDEIQISVGASLDVSYPSFPMIVGKYGLSDHGNRSNEKGAFLGDYKYNPDEQIGDIVLTAGSYYGEGKVMVFGDTSSFQNTAVPHSLPMLKGIFSWLTNTSSGSLKYIQITSSIVLLGVSLFLYWKLKTKKINFCWFPVILAIALLISIPVNSAILSETPTRGNLAYIDISHNEKINLEPYNDDSISGTMINLMRNNYLPIILRDFKKEKIEDSEMLIMNAPTEKIEAGEVDFLKEYMKKGGVVILSTGYEEKDASMPLLEEFNLDIYNIPLGPVPYVEHNPEKYQKKPRFVNSWPIKIGGSKTESFYNVTISEETYHLMAFTPHGKGGLLLIADSQFLKDKNIESTSNYWPGNIQFLKNILDELKERGVI